MVLKLVMFKKLFWNYMVKTVCFMTLYQNYKLGKVKISLPGDENPAINS